MVSLTEGERVALITTIGAIFAASLPILGLFLKRAIERSTTSAATMVIAKNSDEHAINKEVLERIEAKVDRNHVMALDGIDRVEQRLTAVEDYVTKPARATRTRPPSKESAA